MDLDLTFVPSTPAAARQYLANMERYAEELLRQAVTARGQDAWGLFGPLTKCRYRLAEARAIVAGTGAKPTPPRSPT